MKKAILFAILALSIGCVTSKRCFDKFPPEVINTVDTIHVITYRDTIIEKYLPGDTVYAGEKIIVINDTVVRVWRPVEAETELAQAKAWIENDRMKLRLIQKDSVLQFKLDSVIRVSSDTIKIVNTEIHEVYIKKPITKYVSFWVIIGAWFLWTLIFVLLLFRIR